MFSINRCCVVLVLLMEKRNDPRIGRA
ncbi:protein of unknown function (plasmid) [Azospirillum baldaniorum]|uniref:Uncharacterized protein n=1 Tax=Azospirillum baldaniorum TaxID=1064539 RepID=A0A9P1NNF7_9PROT|nr:protein of unknown function [Azospirillum baldaniorum]